MIFSPVLSQKFKGPLGQDGVAIFASLALSDPDGHPLTINIGDLQAGGFTGSQSRGVSDHQDRLMFEILRHRQEGFDLREIQNDRKFSLSPGMPDLLHHPLLFQRRAVKEFEGGHIKPECSLGQMPFLDQVKQVLLEFRFPQFFR